MVLETTAEDAGSLTSVEAKAGRRWRNKLFSKDKDRKASREEQIDDFLASRPSVSSQSLQSQTLSHSASLSYSNSDANSRYSSQSQIQTQPLPRIPPPRLDVSSSLRWPSSQEVLSAESNSSIISTNKTKRPRKGLKVRFSNMPPDIIGEGGEEAEDPTQEISLYRARSNSSTSQRTDNGSSSSNYGGSIEDRTATLPSLLIPQRSGGGPNSPIARLSPDTPIQNTPDSDFLLSLGAQPKGSRLSWRGGGDQSFARSIQAKMRAEEGLALQKALSDSEPTLVREESNSSRRDDHDDSPVSVINNSPEDDRMSSWSKMGSALPDINENKYSDTVTQRYTFPDDDEDNIRPQAAATPTSAATSHPPPYLRSESKLSVRSDKANLEWPSYGDKSDSPPSSKKGLKSIANAVSDKALAEFSSYVDGYNKLFNLAAESVKPSMEASLSEWVRASVWWFIKGRAELEALMMRRRAQSPITEQSQQGIVDLAKSWWINQHIIPQHPELKEFGNMSTDSMLAVATSTGNDRLGRLIGLHQSIISNLRALSMSMKRNDLLPEDSDRANVAQGIDTSIWIRYPFFAPAISGILSGSSSKSMLVDHSAAERDVGEVMPIGDNSRYFCYGRMFVEAGLSSGDDDSEQYAIPCMLSITRDRTDWHVIATITSQNELVNIVIQSDKKKGPTWADVEWHVRSRSLTLRLPRGFELDIQFQEADFKMLWKIVEYTRKVESDLLPRAGESILFADILKVFQYTDSSDSKTFPAEPTQRCRIQLFEKTVQITEGTGTRSSHRGFRFFAVTSPKVKTLSSVSHTLSDGSPIVFGYLRGDDGAPAMILKVNDKGANCSMLLTFYEAENRAKLHSLLTGQSLTENEVKSPEISLQTFSMEQAFNPPGGVQAKKYLKFDTPSTTIFNSRPSLGEGNFSPTILSENLRVFVSTDWGSVTDRINIGPGDLKISLNVGRPTMLNVLRPPHEDLTVAVAENLIPGEVPEQMVEFLKESRTQHVVRRYNFSFLSEMHKFQQAITGFQVLFDGNASMFAISRRRMVVPIYKKWEATQVRLQIIKQEKVVQLAAFFENFSHGKGMNFALKGTDVFESSSRSGKHYIKIVDAKFALPTPVDCEGAEFVCLDMAEYPAEHDDITIGFDSENDRQRFQSALPGPVKEPSRMGSMRK